MIAICSGRGGVAFTSGRTWAQASLQACCARHACRMTACHHRAASTRSASMQHPADMQGNPPAMHCRTHRAMTIEGHPQRRPTGLEMGRCQRSAHRAAGRILRVSAGGMGLGSTWQLEKPAPGAGSLQSITCSWAASRHHRWDEKCMVCSVVDLGHAAIANAGQPTAATACCPDSVLPGAGAGRHVHPAAWPDHLRPCRCLACAHITVFLPLTAMEQRLYLH